MNTQSESKRPSYADIIQEILDSVDGPIPTEVLAEQLLRIRPSSAKNPRRAVLTKIREQEGWKLVYLDAEHILPVRLAYNGARYRVRLTRQNIDQGVLSIPDTFHYYYPYDLKVENITLVDSQGIPIPSQVILPPITPTLSPDTKVEYQAPVVNLREWFHSSKFYTKDHILVTIKDWEKGVFQLERERYGDRNEKLLAGRNLIIADAFFEMLESSQREVIFTHQALPTAYARMPEKEGYPPDHWVKIIEDDPRLETSGWTIHYSDSGFSPLERMIAEMTGQSLVAKGQEFTKEEANHVFRFHAQLTRNSSIWREVEIRGKQTLQELDDVLRIAFQHDTSDHLSGFWKLVVRQGRSRKRYREVDIGTVNPFEYGEGSDTVIAALKLQVGDQIKYVYDFGDWIDHTLKLQSINKPEKGVRYPREVARNKPKYAYCMECQKKGKETIATWVCYTCSNEEQQDIVMCEKCLRNHEDHYTDEILY